LSGDHKIMKTFSNKLLNIFFALFVVIALTAPANLVEAQSSAETAVLSMENLGGTEIVMTGPYDTAFLRFSLPANWLLLDGAELQLKTSAFFSGPADASNAKSQYLGAMLDVYFNGELQQSIPLESGSDVVYQIPLRVRSLPSSRADGTLEVSFFLNAAVDCEYDFHKTTVMISAESQFILPYTVVPVTMDLRKLPWPLYQPSLKDQVATVVVVPNNPSADELQAAMLVMAGLGRMTEQRLPVSLATVNEFDAAIRNENNLVFVGKAGGLSVLSGFDLPIPVIGNSYSAAGSQVDDGILELVASPWNSARTLLVVGGNSDAGVVKAAQAFTTQNLQTGDSPSSVLVADVNPASVMGVANASAVQITTTDATFASLGYGVQTSELLGANWITYEYSIPPGQVPAGQPFIELKFSHSALIDFERSGIAIYLNGDLVGSTAFIAENTNYVTSRINLPTSSFVSGKNQIDVTAALIPRDICSVFAANGLWITVYPESLLHLELAPSSESSDSLGDLQDYPIPFAYDPNLNNTVMVLSQGDPHSWRTAGRIAYSLGDAAGGAILNLEAAFGDDLTELQVSGRNLILVGKPDSLPVVSQLGDAMPARFEISSNVAILDGQGVIYRFSETKSLGYLELLTAPWDENSAILAVLGTNDVGLTYAGDALLTPRTREALRGNFATLDENRPTVVDTRTGQGLGRLPVDMGPLIEAQLTPTPSSAFLPGSTSDTNNRKSILLGIQLVVGLMVIVAVVAFFLRRRTLPPR
jgi:cellulose synthase operon protein B